MRTAVLTCLGLQLRTIHSTLLHDLSSRFNLFLTTIRAHKAIIATPANPPITAIGIFVATAAFADADAEADPDPDAALALALAAEEPVAVALLEAIPVPVAVAELLPAEAVGHVFAVIGVYVWLDTARAEEQILFDAAWTSATQFIVSKEHSCLRQSYVPLT